MRKYVIAEGMVHLIDPNHAEYTVCGDTFDLFVEEPGYEWTECHRGPVTCPKCANVILTCRGVHVRTIQ